MINIAEVMEQYAKEIEGGMTLRDYFAGLAMQGLIANSRRAPDGNHATTSWYAKGAYLMADAMLKARETK
jgi:hypothetical protein